MRYLVKIRVFFDGKNKWTLNSKHGVKVFTGTREEFAKYLMRIKAKDDITDPRSFRGMTYLKIVDEILSGKDSFIWVWSNNFPTTTSVVVNR